MLALTATRQGASQGDLNTRSKLEGLKRVVDD
jgi:hypothetical protein